MQPTWPIFAATAVAGICALMYLATHVVGIVAYVREKDGSASGLSLAAWILSFASGCTGPGVILGNLVAVALGVLALRGAPSNKTRIAARTGITAGTIIVLMAVAMTGLIVFATL